MDKILKAFLYNDKLKFNELEKILKLRSNKLAYYLKKLIEKEVLEKEGEYYKLTKTSESIIPYISDKKAVIPVILIAIKNNKGKIFLHKREKRPFKEKMSLPGGRIVINESIKDATERIMKEKFDIICKFEKINSISLEHVKKEKNIVHSFLLIFVTAKTKQDIKYYDIKSNTSKIISSDYKLMQKFLDKKIEIENLITNS